MAFTQDTLVDAPMSSTLNGYPGRIINPNGNAIIQFCSCTFFNKKVNKNCGSRKEIRKLTFRGLAFRRSESRERGLCLV